jgi:peptidoglycan LD-endopeptidase LytH
MNTQERGNLRKKKTNTAARAAVLLSTTVLLLLGLYLLISYYSEGSLIRDHSSISSSREVGEDEIPSRFIPVYQEAAEEYDVPWRLLAAVHRVETVFSTMDTLVSPVGAEGHLQFMPCTWTGWNHPSCEGQGKGKISEEEKTDPDAIEEYGGYGVDGSGSGEADPYDIEDAVYSAAHYLARSGASEGRLEDAVYAYNRADWYVEDVLSYMHRYEEGYEEVELDTAAVDHISSE